MKHKPLDDLEMHELLRLCYPDHIKNDDDEFFDLSAGICAGAMIDLGDGVEVSLADLLGRVVMLTMPMRTGMTGRLSHCLGEVTIRDGSADMVAAVRRDAPAATKEAEG
jgi:hypothetical protein